VGRLIGSGGMGTVYEAEHVDLGRTVAIKFLRTDRVESLRALKRFEREARIAGRLEHENIVRLLDLGDDGTAPFLVFEYVRGRTLRRDLDELGVRPLASVLDVTGQICRGLALAHAEGIVHRDLKPENVMLTAHADGRLLVKLLDFGVARLYDDESEVLTNTDTALGTAAYMSPEQARGERDLDGRTDIYTLGVVLYEALSGVRPYSGESYNETLYRILNRQHRPLVERRPDLPAPVIDAVERALSKEREDRHAKVEELATALALAQGDAATGARAAPTATVTSEQTSEAGIAVRATPRRSRGDYWIGVATGALYGGAILVVVNLLTSGRTAPPRDSRRVPTIAPVAQPAPVALERSKAPPSPPYPSAPAAAESVAEGSVARTVTATPSLKLLPKPRSAVPLRAGSLRTADPVPAPMAAPAAAGYIVQSPYQRSLATDARRD